MMMETVLIILGVIVLVLVGMLVYKKFGNNEPEDFSLGPVINFKNYSKGTVHWDEQTGNSYFDIEEPHYFTEKAPKVFKQATRLEIDYKFKGHAVPVETPLLKATISPYFQRNGDTYSKDPKYRTYRWFMANPPELESSDEIKTISVPLERMFWTPVTRNDLATTKDFLDAKNDARRVGMVFGGPGGRGHGIIGKGRFELIDVRII